MTTQTDSREGKGPFSSLSSSANQFSEREEQNETGTLQPDEALFSQIDEPPFSEKADDSQVEESLSIKPKYLKRQQQQRQILRQLGTQMSDHQEFFRDIEQRIQENSNEIDALSDEVGNVGQLRLSVSTLEDQVQAMEEPAQSPAINMQTADFVYRSIVATGGVFSLIAALVFVFAFDLFVMAAILVATAGFFTYTFKRGLKPINAF